MDLLVQLCNQVAELEHKHNADSNLSAIGRNVNRMKNTLEQLGYRYHNPLGEAYSEDRSDCEANLLDGSTGNQLRISKVLKPAVFRQEAEQPKLVQ